MKASILLSAVAFGLSLLAAPGMAAPTNDVLPPIIAERTALPSHIPKADLKAEQRAMKKNGQLPDHVEQKGGMGLTETEFPHSLEARRLFAKATAAHIKDLTHYTYLSSNAYCPSVAPGAKWECKNCASTVPDAKMITAFSSSTYHTTGYIIRSDKKKQIDLSFRGTSSLRNFAADLQFLYADYSPVKGAKVHTGFYKAYKEVAEHVVTTMRKQLESYPKYKVVISGHSLGGAIGILAALDLYQRDARFSKDNLSVFTYGGPRVGNPEFAYYFAGTGINLTRTVNEHDVVPHLPPQAFGYLHPGVEHWIRGDKNTVQICDDSELDNRHCSNSIVPYTNVPDHLTYFDIHVGGCIDKA
ncbi:hypothetical protein DFQ28_010953 [Apophysomyces sp. BC1034]|nr:hypothetical protein DFQ30_010200 [Apophysomyces sp. BC1015]KAG0170069.1 hypothetical protein DFQ29_009466 [Apophysomyces sp. BC1021]KAG0184539.1 hypothetical protein DFQ28_010953 [Apophysomyces sp. BC1034]